MGQNITAVATTDDSTVTEIFTWIDPGTNADQTTTAPVVGGSAEDTFTPDEIGTWTVIADLLSVLNVSVVTKAAALEKGDTALLSYIPIPYNKLLGAKDYENASRC